MASFSEILISVLVFSVGLLILLSAQHDAIKSFQDSTRQNHETILLIDTMS